ncbi:MAG: hypothetical protein NTX79_04240 [Candidatus Micrarchaeota archaeon]|nr:hypothetical protein [Candidatus Micrarchaeota archaeon]
MQKFASQQQDIFSLSLHDAEAQSFLNMKGKLPINTVEQLLKAVNP